MAISSGRRNKIDYEKVEEEDRLSRLINYWKGMSGATHCDLTVPDTIRNDSLEIGPYTISANAWADTCYKPSRTIRVQSQISPVQYRGLSNEYRNHIISDVKRKLAESISESIASQASFREDMSYDGTITIEAEIDLNNIYVGIDTN